MERTIASIRDIENQEEHHRKKSFLAEYDELLREFEIDFDPRYTFIRGKENQHKNSRVRLRHQSFAPTGQGNFDSFGQ
jgi:hypothetical protein